MDALENELEQVAAVIMEILRDPNIYGSEYGLKALKECIDILLDNGKKGRELLNSVNIDPEEPIYYKVLGTTHRIH